jgi:phosphoadenosine phosphosulfate reductase
VTEVRTGDVPTDLIEELAEVNSRFETAPAGKVVSWALERFGGSVAVASSFEDVVLMDLAVAAQPDVEVVFLDTGAHFPETLQFVEKVRLRYGLNLTITQPGPESATAPCGTDGCCRLRKVEPLRRALHGRAAWLTGLKRTDAPTRTSAPIVEWDATFGLVKANPLATWTGDDVASYLADHGLPQHPLVAKGYRSIGCAPTTRPVASDEDARAGLWSGSDKVECGLHT